MLNRTLTPEFKQVNDINFLAPVTQQLDNGIPVFTTNAGKQSLVRIEFIFENVNYDPLKPLQAIAVNQLINNGTPTLSAKEIAARVDYYGAFLQTEYGADQSSIRVYTLNKHLAAVLPILKSIITESIFPEQELAIFVQNQKQSLQVSMQKNDYLARKHFANEIFGNTSYGSSIDPEDYDAITRAELLEYFHAAYKPENCTIFAAGKFDADAFRVLNQTFGGNWGKPVAAQINKFNFHLNDRKEVFVERPEAVQSAIRMGRLAINRSHPDFPALQVLNTLLGGYFGSRLMANIREDKGYTYGIGSAVVSLRDAGYLFIATEVGAEVCADAVREINHEIEMLKNQLVEAPELDLVRNYMLGSMLGSLENAFSHADKFKNLYFSKLDYSYYDRYINIVKTITPDEIMALANSYLQQEHFTNVIVGKR